MWLARSLVSILRNCVVVFDANSSAENARTGVLRALVERSTVLQIGGQGVVQVRAHAFSKRSY